MITEKHVFVTQDNSQFATREEAELYELHSEIEELLAEGFVEGEYCTKTGMQALLEKFDLIRKPE